MAQVLEFKLPDLGEGLTEAEIVRWLVEVGDVVAIDQPVVEVETAKAMVEVPCPYGGVVTARFGEEGAELPVGAPLLTVAVGTAPEAGQPATGVPSGSDSGSGAAEETESSGNVLVGYGTGAPAARRRRVRPAPVTAAVPVVVRLRFLPRRRFRSPVLMRRGGPWRSSPPWCGSWRGSTGSTFTASWVPDATG